jgi:AcrR family transcriptional regulator
VISTVCEDETLSRSEQKQAAILESARSVFFEDGYDVASMDRIAAVAGVSKRTVYGHFGSKNELFINVMFDMCRANSDPLGMTLDMEQPVETVLKGLGKAFLTMIFDPEGMALFRILVSQSANFPELGQAFFDGGPKELIAKITEYLGEQQKQGRIQVGDCEEAAGSFLASLFGSHQMRCLVTATPPPDEKQIDAMVDGAVGRFLGGVLKET